MSETSGRKMHPYFLVAWIAWLFLFLSLILYRPEPLIWYSRGVFTAFLLLEGWGAWREGPLGDTLSQLMQLIEAKAPTQVLADGREKRALWYRSWRVVPVGFLVLIAYQAAWTVAYWREPWAQWPLGLALGVTIILWNLYHWLRTEKYG